MVECAILVTIATILDEDCSVCMLSIEPYMDDLQHPTTYLRQIDAICPYVNYYCYTLSSHKTWSSYVVNLMAKNNVQLIKLLLRCHVADLAMHDSSQVCCASLSVCQSVGHTLNCAKIDDLIEVRFGRRLACITYNLWSKFPPCRGRAVGCCCCCCSERRDWCCSKFEELMSCLEQNDCAESAAAAALLDDVTESVDFICTDHVKRGYLIRHVFVGTV